MYTGAPSFVYINHRALVDHTPRPTRHSPIQFISTALATYAASSHYIMGWFEADSYEAKAFTEVQTYNNVRTAIPSSKPTSTLVLFFLYFS